MSVQISNHVINSHFFTFLSQEPSTALKTITNSPVKKSTASTLGAELAKNKAQRVPKLNTDTTRNRLRSKRKKDDDGGGSDLVSTGGAASKDAPSECAQQ